MADKQIHIRLTEKLHKLLRIKAAEAGQTVQVYVNKLLEKGLK